MYTCNNGVQLYGMFPGTSDKGPVRLHAFYVKGNIRLPAQDLYGVRQAEKFIVLHARKFCFGSFKAATGNNYIGRNEWASIWALHVYFFAHIYMQYAQYRKFYTKKELMLQYNSHFKPFLIPINTSFMFVEVESRYLIDVPYEFTFIFLSLCGKCACKLPKILCRCNKSVASRRASAATTGTTIPIFAPSIMFSKLNWTGIPCRWTESFAAFRPKQKTGTSGHGSIKIITDAYIASGKLPEAAHSEKLSSYGLEFVTKLYVSAMGSSISTLTLHLLLLTLHLHLIYPLQTWIPLLF